MLIFSFLSRLQLRPNFDSSDSTSLSCSIVISSGLLPSCFCLSSVCRFSSFFCWFLPCLFVLTLFISFTTSSRCAFCSSAADLKSLTNFSMTA